MCDNSHAAEGCIVVWEPAAWTRNKHKVLRDTQPLREILHDFWAKVDAFHEYLRHTIRGTE